MVIVHTAAAREHMTNCERGIRTIKESARCTVSEMRRVNIKVLPKQVIIHLIYFVVTWITGGPNENGISQVYSPREIVIGKCWNTSSIVRQTLDSTYMHISIQTRLTVCKTIYFQGYIWGQLGICKVQSKYRT